MLSTAILRLGRDTNDLIAEFAPELGALVPIIINLSLTAYSAQLPHDFPGLFKEAV